jgi:hypothetical protein
MTDCIVFWVPRHLETLPAFTTNIEWGVWQNSGKAVFGAPPNEAAPKNEYLKYYAEKLKVPTAETLTETIQAALAFLGEGMLRTKGSARYRSIFGGLRIFNNGTTRKKRTVIS